MSKDTHKQKGLRSLFLLSLTSLGIVYGDIGTSPLYAINEIFFGHGKSKITHFSSDFTLGAISLVIWALTIIVAFKYIVFVLRADNDGEGGVFALYGLLNKVNSRTKTIIMSLLIIAAGLLFGDGIITPAISVISSIEGLAIATTSFQPYIIPITIGILTALFFFQKYGTHKVGGVFGPLVIIWFVAIASTGIAQIVQTPGIVAAFNPFYAFQFIFHHDIHSLFLILGSVMLVVTGGEAMYADMGHFGSLPIRLSWFSITYPALILNYLGQGAHMLADKPVLSNNIFFSITPGWAIFPMVIIATLATIIASQALISGAFSLAQQAISLGLFPLMKVIHTHHHHEGQIYVPFINYSLYIGTVLLVIIFKSSSNLASAYGLAVSGVMLVTTLAMILIAHHYWKWHYAKALLLFGPLALIDSTFLISNSLKIFEGGYIPLAIGLLLWLVMRTWQWGRSKVLAAFSAYPAMTLKELVEIKESGKAFIPRTIVIMTPKAVRKMTDTVPVLKQMFWERYGMLPINLIFLTVQVEKQPYVHAQRFQINKLYTDKVNGSMVSVVMKFGYMEEQNVEDALRHLAQAHPGMVYDFKNWNIHILQERVQPDHIKNMFARIRYTIFKTMLKNTETADHFFGLGKKHPLSIEVIPVYIK